MFVPYIAVGINGVFYANFTEVIMIKTTYIKTNESEMSNTNIVK